MKKILIPVLLLMLLSIPVSAMEFTAPTAPDSAQDYMPQDTESFGEGLWFVIKSAIGAIKPKIAESSGVCLSLIVASLLLSVLHSFTGTATKAVELTGTLLVAVLLIKPADTLLKLGMNTVTELSEYAKLFLPVMTAALAAQGGTATSAALYTGTVLFNTVLTAVISKLIVPMVYIYLCLSIVNSALGEEILKSLRDFVKWSMTWSLKIVLYVFTGYIAVTGVVSGTTDATALKAAKLAISGVVPVVGGILSDASEAILVSAGVMKSAAGIYGLLAITAVWIGPFLETGVLYLMLKISAAICSIVGTKQSSSLIQDFSSAMGLVLAMTGTVCLLLLISTVCFMKGVG